VRRSRTTALPRAAPKPAPRRLVARSARAGQPCRSRARPYLVSRSRRRRRRPPRDARGRSLRARSPPFGVPTRLALRAAHGAHHTPGSGAFTRTRTSMTTPAAVPQGTSSRSPNNPVAAGHSAAPGGRLGGVAPGRRTSRLVPATPAISRLGAFTDSPARTTVIAVRRAGGKTTKNPVRALAPASARARRTTHGRRYERATLRGRPPSAAPSAASAPREPALGRDGVACAVARRRRPSPVVRLARARARGGSLCITHILSEFPG